MDYIGLGTFSKIWKVEDSSKKSEDEMRDCLRSSWFVWDSAFKPFLCFDLGLIV